MVCGRINEADEGEEDGMRRGQVAGTLDCYCSISEILINYYSMKGLVALGSCSQLNVPAICRTMAGFVLFAH